MKFEKGDVIVSEELKLKILGYTKNTYDVICIEDLDNSVSSIQGRRFSEINSIAVDSVYEFDKTYMRYKKLQKVYKE